MADNWVERRALRENYLQNASSVWQTVRSAIDECCTSFRERFAVLARVHNQEQNGHRVLIEVRFSFSPNTPRQISVGFFDTDKEIRVTIDGSKAAVFPIDADENHAFITFQGKEIDADEFTRVALEKALFEPPKPKTGRPATPKSSTEWS
jgi:hypothetical protein